MNLSKRRKFSTYFFTEINMKDAEELGRATSSKEDISNLIDKMKNTFQEVESALNNFECTGNHFYSELKMKISNNFSTLHNVLQTKEIEVLQKLDEASVTRKNCLKLFKEQLISKIWEFSSMLLDLEESNKFLKSTDGSHPRQILNKVERLRFYLVENKSEVAINFNNDVINWVRDYCTLKVPDSQFLESLTNSFSEPETVHLALEPVAKDNKDNKDSISSAVVGSVEKNYENSIKFIQPFKINKLKEEHPYSVQLCHIVNPDEFFVILTDQLNKRNEMESKLGTLPPETPQTICIDDLYLLKHKLNDKWYRVKVERIFRAEKFRTKAALIYKLDYGLFQKVSTSELKCIPEDISKEPAMAIKCKLFDCSPKNREWSLATVKFLKNILNSNGTMLIFKINPKCLEVDLQNIDLKNKKTEKIISLRNEILTMELNILSDKKLNCLKQFFGKNYPNQILPSTGQIFDAVISYVESPTHFFAQMTQDLVCLEKLSIQLENYYVNNLKKGYLYDVKVGMPCAAIFPLDGKWYRGKIVEAPKKNYLRILYVDFGNTEVIEWSSVRKLKQEFASYPPMGFSCVLKENEKSYLLNTLKQRTTFLESDCGSKTDQYRSCSRHRFKVVNVIESIAVLQVLPQKEIENQYTVADDEIHCTTKSKCTKGKEKETNLEPDDDENMESVTSDIDLESRNSEEFEEPLNDPLFDGRNESECNKSRVQLSNEKLVNHLIADKSENSCSKIFRPKVEILTVISPSLIYATFPELASELAGLQSELNKFYKNTPSLGKETWAVNEKCVVYCPKKENWYRGVIIELLSKDKVKVVLKDIGVITTELMSSLRCIENSFLNYPVCTFKCHLSDVWPVGNTWPVVSCEFLTNEIETLKNIYMTKRGEIENASLPVVLWARKIIPGTALEPEGEEWINLNQLLIDQGLALPNMLNVVWLGSSAHIDSIYKSRDSNGLFQNTKKAIESPETEKKNLDATVTSTLEWLPPVPIKSKFFIGIPTYVDVNAIIYLHVNGKDENELKEIQRQLFEIYGKSEPDSSEYNFQWAEGELCIAKYHLDDCWYRGRILKVNEDSTFEVEFVDYGNIETCQLMDLRKNLLNTIEIPILSHKVSLLETKPGKEEKKWSDLAIEFLHGTVVDKKCEVTVLKHSENYTEPLVVSLKVIQNGVDVLTLLERIGMT